MKLPRAALVPALLLVLALPLAAEMRMAPVMEGPPPASIEGTITSVNVPFAGGGPVVTLLDGLVAFDATGASVRFADGRAGTTADLAAGQRVVALVDPSAAMPRATSIVVLLQRSEVTLTGTVGAVDTAAKTLKVLGFTVHVTGKTAFGGPWDGAGQFDLGGIRVGDLVLVTARDDAGILFANRILKLSPTPDATARIHGVVATIGTESWSITLKDGAKATVKVDAQTKLVGEPMVGDEVDVLARKQSDGSLLALLIAKSVVPPTVPTERYAGVVRSITKTAWTVGPKVGDGPDRVFAVNEKTRIVGEPKVGDEVEVLAQKQADGTSLAVVIAKKVVAPPMGEVAFDGVLKSVSQIGSSAGAGAVWTVGETRVLVTRSTVVRGEPKVGDKVHVEGMKMPDGTVGARLVAKI